MSRTALSQFTRRATRSVTPRVNTRITNASSTALSTRLVHQYSFQQSGGYGLTHHSRSISTSSSLKKGLSPDSADPKPKVAETNETASEKVAADISTERFHELSDTYLNTLVEQLERLQEKNEQLDVEYSSGVLNLTFPPNGTYVINKQPPNKQIWLSSPITGPKRFDFVIASEGQDVKEGTGEGEWMYLRDGTTLDEILLKEVGVDMDAALEPLE